MDDGSVSVSELELWAQSVQADGMSNIYDNCRDCVVAKATSDPDEQNELLSTIVALQFGSDE